MTCRMRHALALLLSTALPAFAVTSPALAAESAPSAAADTGAEISALYRSGDYEEALTKSLTRLAALRADKALAAKLPGALNSHGAILIGLERYAEAETALKEAVAVGEKVLGRNDPTTLTALGNLAACYLFQKKTALALSLYEDVVARREAVLGKDDLLGWQKYDSTLLRNVIDLNALRVDQGQPDKAIADLEPRLDSLNGALDDNALRAELLELARDAYTDAGRLAELAPRASEFVSRSGAVSSLARHPYTADKTDLPDLDMDYDVERQKDVLYEAYVAAGKTAEARDLYLTMPDRLRDAYNRAENDDAVTAALADYTEAVARLAKTCRYSCSSEQEIYREILLDQNSILSELGRAAEIPANLERQAQLAEARFGKTSPRAADAWDKTSASYAEQGRAADAEVAKFRAAAARGERDPELGDNIELAIARKLIAAGRDADAEAIYRQEMECGFGPAYEGDNRMDRAEPCESAMLAMREYAALLEKRGKKADAEFFRLPHEIVTEYKARKEKSAQDKSERLLVLAGKSYKPEDRYYRMAMGIFDGVHMWYDLPLYDIPKAMRLCGRWDEPEPVKTVTSGDNELLPPVTVSVAPQATNYFHFNTGYLSPQDPRRIFYHSITNKAGMSFAAYMNQCLAVGDAKSAARFGAWADAEAERMGYPTDDRYDLLLPLAQAQRAAGDFAGADRSYQKLVGKYLTTDALLPPFGGEKIFEELIQFYAFTGRTEKLQALVLQMVQSEKFAKPGAQVGLRKMLFELYLGSGDTDNAGKMLDTLNPYSNVYDEKGLISGSGDPEQQQRYTDAIAVERSTLISSYARLMLAKGDKAAALKAIDLGLEENRKDRAATPDRNKTGDPRADMIIGLPDGVLNGVRVGILGEEGDYKGALALLEENPSLKLFDYLFEQIRPALADTAQLQAEMRSDPQTATLLLSARTLFAATAQMALKAGNTERAAYWFERLKMIPQVDSGGPNILEQLVNWSGVVFGIVDPARRSAALDDARKLSGELEKLWALGNGSALDNQYKRDAVKEAPQYFGDIAALEWRARSETPGGVQDADAFLHVQRAIMDVVDLTIAAQTGRAIIARDRPDLLPLLDEREQLAQALLPSANVSIGTNGMGDSALKLDGYAPGGLDARLNRISELDAKLAREAPQFTDLTSSLPVSLVEAQKLLGPDEAILMVAPGNYGTQVMLVTADALDWQEAPLTLVEAAATVKRLRWFLGGDVPATTDEQALWSKDVRGGRNGFDRATAYALYQQLVEPFAERLQGRSKLFVAAGGPFTSLPLSVLVAAPPAGDDDDPEALRKTAWLADRFALVQIPSIQSLALLRKYGRVAAGPKDAAFMGFGAPELTGPPAPRGARGGPAVSEVGAVYGGNGTAVVDVEKLRKLAALPGTGEELTSIASALSAGDNALALGPAATESRVKQADLRSPAILAFATHALTAGQSFGARQPGLVLTPPDVGTAMDDGLLTAPEIAGLKIGADWVILSACNTAAPDGQGSPGLSGLARSFFEAGARGLLVSHWPVRDDVAAKLTVRTVEARRDIPDLTRAEALQRAMREIRMNRSHDGLVTDEKGQAVQQSWAHPNAWAPFSLIGDGR